MTTPTEHTDSHDGTAEAAPEAAPATPTPAAPAKDSSAGQAPFWKRWLKKS